MSTLRSPRLISTMTCLARDDSNPTLPTTITNARQRIHLGHAHQVVDADPFVERVSAGAPWAVCDRGDAFLGPEGVAVVHERLGPVRQLVAGGGGVRTLKRVHEWMGEVQ